MCKQYLKYENFVIYCRSIAILISYVQSSEKERIIIVHL